MAFLSSNRRQWLAAAACAAWAWPVVAALAGEDPRRPWPKGRPTPPLRLPSLDGSAWQLDSALGRPVLLNFWASWCEPCRAEMPSLEQLAAQHRDKGLQVVAINFREGESAVRRFIGNTALGLPVVYDTDGAAAKAFGVHTFPSTVAIDRRGKVLFVVSGEIDWRGPEAERWLAPLL